MARDRVVWIDAERCTGCGACIEACPVGAIALMDGTAHVEKETCTGCGACLEVCPEDAIHSVVEGELVQVEERPMAERRHVAPPTPAVDRARPLVEAARPAVTAVGIGVLIRAVDALLRAVGHWLAERPEERGMPPASQEETPAPGRANGGGRRVRRRRRGR
jgi:NAD-dependent dihydropyrimidine dehydrogenase PreA subunit